MPAPLLRREVVISAADATWTSGVLRAPLNRAVVISKAIVLISNSAVASCRISLAIGPDIANAGLILWQRMLNLGDTYAETAVILPANNAIFLRADGTAAGNLQMHVFGQEVDNI